MCPECSCKANSPNPANPRTSEALRPPTRETQKTDRTSYCNMKQLVTFEPLDGFEPFLNIDSECPSGQWKFKVISVPLVYFCWSRPSMLKDYIFFSCSVIFVK